jgi:hypothetical protein
VNMRSDTLSNMRFAALALLWLVLNCKSAKEQGQDLVDDKLDLVEGAADALGKRGGSVGRTAAKAIADTVKGVGSGVKDTLMPPVQVGLASAAAQAKLQVMAAVLDGARDVHVTLTGGEPFKGGLWLEAVSDAGPLARATAFLSRELSFAQPVDIHFVFAPDARLSGVGSYVLHSLPVKSVSSVDPVVQVSQLAVEGSTATVYAVFSKACAPNVQLKALAADGAEVARAMAQGTDVHAADSAEFLRFSFAPEADLAAVARFELKATVEKAAKR